MSTATDFTKSQWRQVQSLSDDDLDVLTVEFEAQEDFWAFRKYLNPKMKRGWWQHVCAIELQKFYEAMAAGERPVLLFEGPRQHGKTRQVVEFLAWVSGKNPDLRELYASYSDRLGKRANRDLQKIFANPRYLRVFPATQIQLTKFSQLGPNGEKLPAAQRTQTIIEYVAKEGSFRNTTVLGAINGEGFDLGVLDDPLKGRTESHSEVKRETAWNWFAVDFIGCLADCYGLLIIAARRHKDDPVSRLRRLWGDRVRVLSYPAIATKDEPFRKEGQALFPELKPIEMLLDMKAIMPPDDWEATMQQNPRDEGGNIIKGKWFKRYTIAPLFEYRAIFADTAQKTKEANDYSVFQCWGKGRDGRLYLVDQIRDKWEAPELKRKAKDFWAKHAAYDQHKWGMLRKMYVEDKSSGTGLIQEIKSEGRIPVEGIERDKDKYMRVLDVLGYLESEYVFLPDGAAWVADYVKEHEDFTADESHDHDDQIDPTVDAIKTMLAGKNAAEQLRQMLGR